MPHKVILDTDPGVDDVLAILLALSSPEIDLALISIVFGNTHAPVARSNLLKIYHLLAQEVAQTAGAEARYGRLKGQVKTVLAMGEDGPIGGEKAVAAYFVGFEWLFLCVYVANDGLFSTTFLFLFNERFALSYSMAQMDCQTLARRTLISRLPRSSQGTCMRISTHRPNLLTR